METEDSAESPSTRPSKAITVMRERQLLCEVSADNVQGRALQVERQHATQQVGLLFHTGAEDRNLVIAQDGAGIEVKPAKSSRTTAK